MIKRVGDIVVIQLSSSDSNIYLHGDTVIDAGTGLNFTRLKDVLKILKLSMEDIKQVVNTHCHFDHTGGNGYFYEAQCFIHKNDAEIIRKGDQDLTVAGWFDGTMTPKKVHTELQDGDTIKTSIGELEVIHTPGHTMGSICLMDKKRSLLFTGDTVFETAIGRIDFPNSDPSLMEESLKKLAALKVKTVLPGHGNPFDKKHLDTVAKMSVADFQKKLDEGEIDEDYI